MSSLSCPVDLDTQKLHTAVHDMYSRVAFAEAFRVLRPGGRLQLADIVVKEELSESIRQDYELWAT